MATEIALTEEFNDPQGVIWNNYDAYQQADRANMATLKHVDLRTFDQYDTAIPLTVLYLSTQQVGVLSTQTVGSLSGVQALGKGEGWSGSICEKLVGDGYINSMSILADNTGTVTTQSVIAKSYGALQSTNYTNLITEPSFEAAIVNWSAAVVANNNITSAGATLTRAQTVVPRRGNYHATLVVPATTNTGMAISVPGTFKQGVAYTFSIYVRISTGTNGNMRLVLGQGATDNAISGSFTATTTWTRQSVTWTPTADRTSVFATFKAVNTSAAATYYVDSAMVNVGSSAPTYFDGNELGYQWSGTPNLSTSVGPFATTLETIDLLTGFADDDYVSLSFPAYGGATLTAASCFIDLTSNASGDFTAGPTASVAWSASQTAPSNGSPSELRFLRSQFNQNSINLGAITGVRLRVLSTSGSPVSYKLLGGIRMLSKTWQYSGVDLDTRYGRLRKTIPKDANSATVPAFTWPILFRSEQPSGDGDPTPIDSEFGVVFNPGTITQSNTISLYFREVTQDFLTQLDINTIPQQGLDGYNQPDIGTAKYNSRLQTDLERYTQSTIDSEINFNLERTPDYLSASWIQVFLQWGAGGAGTVTMVNTEGGGYSFPLTTTLVSGTSYVLRVRVEDTGIRAQIYSLNSTNDIVAKVFDSTLINDGFTFKRRKGRFGWSADLKDGGAYIDSIRQRYANFAEYRSLPFLSNTPVIGAELFVGNTPNSQLYVAPLNPGPFNTTNTVISTDQKLTTTGSSNKITNTDSTPLQGIQTNSFLINDWANSGISFDVFYPAAASPLKAFLFSEDNAQQIPLVLPEIARDEWQSISIEFPLDATLTGRYKLVVIQLGSGSPNWWIDNISIFTRSVVWDGRAVADDPWKSNNAQWTPFKDIENTENGGVVFPRRGNELQIRGRALRQFAEIDRVQFLPKYAGLGNLPAQAVGGTQGKPTGGSVTVSFSTVNPGTPALTRNLTASATSNYGFLPTAAVSCQWNFGDGTTGYGDVVQHTWAAAGTYSVTLVATDRFGYQGTYTANVTV